MVTKENNITKAMFIKRGFIFCVLMLFVAGLVTGLSLIDTNRGVSRQTDEAFASTTATRTIRFYATVGNHPRFFVGESVGSWTTTGGLQDARIRVPNIEDVQESARAQGGALANVTVMSGPFIWLTEHRSAGAQSTWGDIYMRAHPDRGPISGYRTGGGRAFRGLHNWNGAGRSFEGVNSNVTYRVHLDFQIQTPMIQVIFESHHRYVAGMHHPRGLNNIVRQESIHQPYRLQVSRVGSHVRVHEVPNTNLCFRIYNNRIVRFVGWQQRGGALDGMHQPTQVLRK